MNIHLKVLLPTDVLVDERVRKVSAEAANGSFTMLPRHIDFVTTLVPGLFHFVTEEGNEVFLAMADGVLVKKGFDVNVSALNAVRGDDLRTLWQTVREEFEELDEQERRARSVIASLEMALARQIASLGGPEL